MKVLVGCEFSQTVTKAFRDKGHEAYSCDILPTEGNPEWHLQMDVLEAIKLINPELGVFHPPCTYLSYAGIKHWNKPGRAEKREKAMRFFMELVNAPLKRICIENPVGYPNIAYREPDQIIHPYYFGEPFQKRTCLWLKNLPKLRYRQTIIPKPEPLYICQGEKCKGKKINWVEGIRGVKNRQQERARFFKGVADAMAEQWGNYHCNQLSLIQIPTLDGVKMDLPQKEDLEKFHEMYEEDYEVNRDRECGENCSHYDSLNRCCWLVTEKGIMIHVSEGDLCHHGLKVDY